jgi:hypothetical protein
MGFLVEEVMDAKQNVAGEARLSTLIFHVIAFTCQ